jgi:hypothetical protein
MDLSAEEGLLLDIDLHYELRPQSSPVTCSQSDVLDSGLCIAKYAMRFPTKSSI